MTTPSLHVCPWAAWAVAANPGANGNCFRVTRSTPCPDTTVSFAALREKRCLHQSLQGYHLRASQPLTHCLLGAASVPAFKPLNAPQQPYTVFCWSFYLKLPVASLQTRQPSAAALHALFLGRSAVCRPPDAYCSQPHYTFCRWGFTSAVCQPSDLYSNR